MICTDQHTVMCVAGLFLETSQKEQVKLDMGKLSGLNMVVYSIIGASCSGIQVWACLYCHWPHLHVMQPGSWGKGSAPFPDSLAQPDFSSV